MDKAKEEQINDLRQLYTTGAHLLGELQAASLHALKLAKKGLEGADPHSLRADGPAVTVQKLMLTALEQGREGAEASLRMSKELIELKKRVEIEWRSSALLTETGK